MVFCIDSVAGIMPIITCPGCNSTNTRFCHEKGFVENTRFCRKTGFIANTRLFGFVWCRLLRRHLGFDSDFAQISGLKIGGWHLCSKNLFKKKGPSSQIFTKILPVLCLCNLRQCIATTSHHSFERIGFINVFRVLILYSSRSNKFKN